MPEIPVTPPLPLFFSTVLEVFNEFRGSSVAVMDMGADRFEQIPNE